MRPILGIIIMHRHNEAINKQFAFRHSQGGGIAMEVLGGVVIARNFGHVKNGAAPPNPPTTLFFAVSNTRSATLFTTGRTWSLWGLCLWWLGPP